MIAIAALLCLLGSPARAQSFESWSAKADKAQKAGQTALALDYWDNALRVWSPEKGKGKRAKALAARAALREKAGQLDEALADLDAAVKLDSKKPSYFDRRGQLQLSRGKLEDAISDFYAAAKLDINYGPAYEHRAQAYERQGEMLFAKEDYKSACRLGVKASCGAAKKIVVKKEPKASVPVPPVEPAAAPAETPKAPERERAPVKAPEPSAKPKPLAPIDVAACRAAVESCNEEGNSLTVCLRRVKPCLAKPAKGCCPRACLHEFERKASEETSDAELFREIFGTDGSCKRLIGAK